MKSVVLVMCVALCGAASFVAVSQDLSDIERDALALELFLQDKKDHKEICPHIHWEQPKIDKYKEALESQLPAICKE